MGNQYAGNAGNDPPTVFVPDDSDAPTAGNFDPGVQGGLDRTAFQRARFSHAEMNWRPLFPATAMPGGAYTKVGAAAWDPTSSRWLLGVTDPTFQGRVFVSSGLDDGAGWVDPNVGAGTVFSGAVRAVEAVCGDATVAGAAWCVDLDMTSGQPAHGVNISLSTPTTPAWTLKRNIVDLNGHYTASIHQFRGYTIVGLGAGATSNGLLTSSGDHGATWSDYTGLNVFGLKMADNGSLLLAVPWDSTSTTYYTTPDGVAWTARTFPFAGRSLWGVAWDAVRQLWIVLTHLAPNHLEIWASADGITGWTLAGTGPAGFFGVDLAVLANGYMVTLSDAVSGGPSGQIFSVDGGATWYASQAVFPDNEATSSVYWQPSQFAPSSTFGLLAFNAHYARFSRCAGLPPSL